MSGNPKISIDGLVQLERLAAILAAHVCPGSFIALTGNLGAGKTTFSQFMCQYLGVTAKVTSPTFTLLNEYPSHRSDIERVIHGDFYRLSDEDVAMGLSDLDESLEDPHVILLVEWADNVPSLTSHWGWHLEFTHDSQRANGRHVIIHCKDPDQLAALISDWNRTTVLSRGDKAE